MSPWISKEETNGEIKDEDLPLKVQEEQTSPSNDGEMYDFNHLAKQPNLVIENVDRIRAHEVLLSEDKPIRKGKMISFKAFESHLDVVDNFKLVENPKDQ